MKTIAYLILEDSTFFKGNLIGDNSKKQAIGEIIFNTSMSGYQEIITDPSYKGQIVCFTYPSIGNYGINLEDNESDKPYLEAIIMKDYCEVPSNFKSQLSLEEYLTQYNKIALTNIDTRALVRHIREKGAVKAGIFAYDKNIDFNDWLQDKLKELKKLPSMDGRNLTNNFDVEKSQKFVNDYIQTHQPNNHNSLKKLLVLDFGIKYSILKYLINAGFHPIIYEGDTPYTEWKNLNLNEMDGFFFSNGPGDPSAVTNGIKNIQYLLSLNKPSMGICLGHQMLSLALGAKTYKMQFGHHGGNQPVQLNKNSNKVKITAQNHGFAVHENSLEKALSSEKNILFEVNPNDNTLESFFFKRPNADVISIQYHPEAGPGPRDAVYLFNDFYKSI